MTKNINKNIAIITGASSGLGKEFARLLLQETTLDEIWAVARNQEKLDNLQTDLGDKIRNFSVDLSDLNQIKNFQNLLDKEQPQITYLINNAGFAKLCSYQDISLEESINMIDLNCSGVVAMGLIAIPYMTWGSKILNIASQASFQPMPYQNIYGSTKAFVRNYSRALNIELKEKGISVTAVCPGWIDTNLFERAKVEAKKATHNFVGMVTADKVAAKALKDAQKNKDISVYSFYVKCGHLLAKILPQRLMMKIWLHQQKL